MANIADGLLTIKPADASGCAGLVELMKAHIAELPGAFSYGGNADVFIEDDGVRVAFTGR